MIQTKYFIYQAIILKIYYAFGGILKNISIKTLNFHENIDVNSFLTLCNVPDRVVAKIFTGESGEIFIVTKFNQDEVLKRGEIWEITRFSHDIMIYI